MKIGFNLKYFLAFLVLLAAVVFIAVFITEGFIRYHFGDILIVVLIYCAIKTFIRNRLKWLAVYIFAFAVVVEIGQYFNLVSVLGLEQSRVAKIIIGVTFDPYDVLMYFIGCVLIFFWDRYAYPMQKA